MITLYRTLESFKRFLNHFNYSDQTYLKPDSHVKNPNRQVKLLESVDELNTIYQNCRKFGLNPIMRTDKGTIKKNLHNNMFAFDLEEVKNSKNNVVRGYIITVIIGSRVWVFKYGYLQANSDSTMTGIKGFKQFSKQADKQNIDLSKYEEKDREKALKIKEQIQSSVIENYKKDTKYYHVNHMDFNAAWPSEICKHYHELKQVFLPLSKEARNAAIGYMQSKYINYKYANLAKIAINGCAYLMKVYYGRLISQGFEVLGINTDGIWYRDKTEQNRLYHDDNEGFGFGKWKNDHIDCEWYAYSDGQYYFIEKGKMNVKARGYYSYESVKAREEWNEEDFFKAMSTKIDIQFYENYGIVIDATKE